MQSVLFIKGFVTAFQSLKPHKPVLHYYFFFPHFTALHLSILSPKMSEDKESHNISPVNERAGSGSGERGLNSDDISATSPVAKNEIKEHDDKDDKNVAGLSGVKIGDLCASATSPTGAKNEVKEHDVGEHSGSDNKNVAGPSGVNTASDDDTFVDVVNFDENENNGLTAADILIAQIEAEKQKKASSSSSNDAESSGKNKNEPTSKRQRLD
ncbi:hypothetical protein GmHk_13G039365 [Glycine max]|nr:hypothetical protein GmHk_13G039365 [Glycine max]